MPSLKRRFPGILIATMLASMPLGMVYEQLLGRQTDEHTMEFLAVSLVFGYAYDDYLRN